MRIEEFVNIYYNKPEEQRYMDEWVPILDRFVKKAANKYLNLGEFDDIYQIAWIGATRAIQTYNPDKGAQFTTYAVTCMANEINLLDRYNKRKCRSVLSNEHMTPVFLNGSAKVEGDDMPMDELIGNVDENFDMVEVRDQIDRLKKVCTPRQIEVLDKLAEGKNLIEIGKELNTTKSNVCRIRKLIQENYKNL